MAKGRVGERAEEVAAATAGPRDPQDQALGDSLEVKANAEAGSARMSLLILVSIFLSAASVMFLVYKNFPQLSDALDLAPPSVTCFRIWLGDQWYTSI
ncbi:transmembrane protein 41B isoform X2 [Vombatus ursinus]|uniref:transmembrane protein 41B isoform X2 n=1 Tax=Vombatus ursinus TaxID=29139 RepID=UPI000FFD1DA3|nr:transmembrane protein 41B isoform X2 [Vombatus ursinus]